MNKVKMNSGELKETLRYIIKNNRTLQTLGKKPITASICGAAGLGKTSVVEQLAEELDLKHFVVINLSQLDELGDLVGIPMKEYYMTKKTGDKVVGKWVEDKVIETYVGMGYTLTNNSRMGYSKPAWIAGKGENGILVLDDYTRAQPRFMQAVMEIINKQEYISWKLPKNWTILLTENPDDGTYNVTDIDAAAKSRYMTFDIKWEVDVWAEWAEKNKIDARCINFMLMTPEVIKNDRPEVNPRALVNFFNTISGIDDYNKSLSLVQNIGEACVGPEVTTMFSMFINNNMDKMISPQDILDVNKTFEDVSLKIKELVKEGVAYRADLAYVLTTRLINYLQFVIEPTQITSKVIQRIKDLVTKEVLGADLKFILAKKVVNTNSKFNALLADATVVDMILE